MAQGSDLWNTLFKSQYATVELPDLEFEVSADGKRKIDSLYNHIASVGARAWGTGGGEWAGGGGAASGLARPPCDSLHACA